MGWNINQSGFNIVLSADVPELVSTQLRGTVESFLADNDLSMSNICSYIFHSGGPKVLKAMESALGLPPNALASSWNSLRQRGNLSSASVLTVMQDFLLNRPGSPGCYSMIGAMGPAFCSELLLLQW
jgi:alkylresorcinol/alkylpyrone synthase